MASDKAPSTKRLQIDKANATMVAAVAISSFVFVFSVVAVKALWSQRGYQQRVIAKKEKARDQLKSNVDAAQNLVTSYKSFVQQSQNIIGGDPNGSGPRDGDNAKIILDALPSKYDFIAMANSMHSLFSTSGIKVTNISGTDDEVNQAKNASSVNPQPIPMPFTLSVQGSYGSVQKMLASVEKSIRPVDIDTMIITGTDTKLTVNITAKTYYQSAKSLKINTEVVK